VKYVVDLELNSKFFWNVTPCLVVNSANEYCDLSVDYIFNST
jgi:hypothetical protein